LRAELPLLLIPLPSRKFFRGLSLRSQGGHPNSTDVGGIAMVHPALVGNMGSPTAAPPSRYPPLNKPPQPCGFF